MKAIGFKQWVFIAAGVALCGCAEKLTYQRFQMIQEGASTRAEVEATLGTSKRCEALDQKWVYYDEDRQITATIDFEGDKVCGKEWMCPKHGWEGQSPQVKQPGEAEHTRIQKIE